MVDNAKIRTLREKRGLSMEQAAELAGLGGRQRWYEVESGRVADPAISTLAGVARALGVKVDELLKKGRRAK